MTNGAGDLPAYPMRVACHHMTAHPSRPQQQQQQDRADELWLLTGAAGQDANPRAGSAPTGRVRRCVCFLRNATQRSTPHARPAATHSSTRRPVAGGGRAVQLQRSARVHEPRHRCVWRVPCAASVTACTPH
jgi:hypothetical protein